MNKIQKILEKLYWLKTNNKNLTKKQFHAVDTIREELQKRCIKHEKMKKKQLEKLQKELGGNL